MSNFEVFESKIMQLIKDDFEVTAVDMKVKKEFYYPKVIHLLKFNVSQYEVKGLGNMAILQGKGLGVMRLFTAVFTPHTQKDIPFVIIDFIKMANKRTVFVEVYNHYLTEKEGIKRLENQLKKLDTQYSMIEDYNEKPNWYTTLRNRYSPLKKGTKEQDDLLEELVLDYFKVYLEYVKQTDSHKNSHNKQLEQFVNDLIDKGNPSQSVLEKALGKAETEKLFKEVIFYYK